MLQDSSVPDDRATAGANVCIDISVVLQKKQGELKL